MHVLLTYSAVKRRVSMGSCNLVPALSAHFSIEGYRYAKRTNVSFFDPSSNLVFRSKNGTFVRGHNDITKKERRKIERGEFITPPRPTGRRSNKEFSN